MDERFQEGLFHRSGQRPGPCFTLLFLRAAPGATARKVGGAFAELWGRYQRLKEGRVQDLEPERVPPGNLSVLVGYGLRAFKLPEAGRPLPAELGEQHQFLSPRPTGGGPFLHGSGLAYDADVLVNRATEDLALQFIGDTQLAVHRAVVETWKFLHDLGDAAPLMMTGFFQGFSREDGRSWIDFHDGISNLKSSERAEVMAIKPGGSAADAWVEGGTTMAFLRLSVDLAAWRRLPEVAQELLVGRAKRSGCPFASVDASGRGVPVAGCAADPSHPEFREPPAVADERLLVSHVQRANQHRRNLTSPDSLRIYRQGYEFLEPLESAPGFRAGLNFVSFQDSPERVFRMLTTPGWLGRTNFGGDPATTPPELTSLLRVRAGGVFLVPPVVPAEPFPGASVFGL
ncbi:Dyp-type peroxidase [Sorangium sp. So ce131]|uniref:Dyp-type peroxidase n=1 Tax=Sorangium sp. So ce131 TaxID=3133282 RepID=UPI003F60B0BD